MTPQQACPPRSVWQEIVGGGFVDASLGELGSHLDTCPTCQAAVEKMMGRERAYLAISAELRQELPPASPVCQRMLAELQAQEPTGPIASGACEAEDRPLGKRVCCPHCLELVHMQEAVGCEPMRCPLCWRAVGVAEDDDTPAEYDVGEDKHMASPEVRDYVQSLDARAKLERKRKPYHRGGFPVNLAAAVVFILGGFLILGYAFTSQEGLMSSLINGILPAFLLFLLGALCLIFWAK